MEETTPQPTPPAKKPILSCDRCDATYRRLNWSQGMKCPKCKSPDFYPVTVIGGAIDYTLADRSQGYAIEDIRFAQLAKWAGIITPSQYTQALKRQRQLAGPSQKAPHIAQVMTNERFMESAEIAAVFAAMCTPRPGPDDEAFADLALQNRCATQEQVQECRLIQTQIAKGRNEVPPLGQIMFEKRYLNEAQVQALYQKMAGRELGVVHQIREAYEDSRELSAFERIAGTSDEPERRRMFYTICILSLLVVAVWSHWIFGGGGEKMWFKCGNADCGKLYKARRVEEFPATCRFCKKKEARYAQKCINCGEVFGTDGWWGRPVCPHCGKARIEPYRGK